MRTVAGELEGALSQLFATPVKVTAAGRTDAGVHAAGQVISFISHDAFPIDKLSIALNTSLPPDVTARDSARVPDGFSARASALERRYVYAVLNRRDPSAVLRRFAHHEYRTLDLERMREAAAHLIGEHDFVTFCGVLPERGGTVRTIEGLEIERDGEIVRFGRRSRDACGPRPARGRHDGAAARPRARRRNLCGLFLKLAALQLASRHPAANSGAMKIGIEVVAASGSGVLHELTGAIARFGGDISSVEIVEEKPPRSQVVFEIDLPGDPDELYAALRELSIVERVTRVETMQSVYGKRIIIAGGGAQVGQVALGAIAEADRHNLRGEHISVDTIPLVGERELAAAVRGAARLPRVKAIVLAGSLMGGEIEQAAREVRGRGLLVVSLNMAGSVPEAADLVVTDPVQAGVMTVMIVADTAKFSLERLKRRVF